MVRSAASKVIWVGRATVFVVGLAVIMALLFGVATMALGANGDFFKVGRSNFASAVSVLVANVFGLVILADFSRYWSIFRGDWRAGFFAFLA